APGRDNEQVAARGGELHQAGAALESIVPDAGTGLLFSMPTRWAFDYHPPLQDPSARADKQGPPDRAAYERVVYRFYGGLERTGHQIKIMHAEDFELLDAVALAAQLPTLVVPGLYLASDRLVSQLLAYTEA